MSGRTERKKGEDAGASSASLDDLMRASQTGDAQAYDALLREVARRMRNLVRARAPFLNSADTEDLVQDILLSLHAARATWDPTRPFMPWIVTIARNRMADHARRFGRRSALDLACRNLSETFCDGVANNHADAVANFLDAQEAIKRLSPAEREAVGLLRLRQMTLAEAAAESGSSIAALKVAVHRASNRLRSLIKDGN